MALPAELKNLRVVVVLIFLSLLQLLNNVKLFLGLATERYGMFNPFKYKGLWCHPMIHSGERTAAAENYDNFRPDDVLVATYPKTGTNFLLDVLISIYKEKGLIPRHYTKNDAAVSLEMNLPQFLRKAPKGLGVSAGPLANVENQPSPRIMGSHLPFNFLPPKVQEGKVKVINCTRNPKSVVCSMLPFFKSLGIVFKSVTMQEYVQWYMEGNVLHGGYFDYLREWYIRRNNTNMLNLQFENLKKDLTGNVKTIAEFLNMELSPQQVEAVVAANTFANKKKAEGRLNPFYKKGKSGGWKSEITVEQNEMLDEWIQQEMKGMEDAKFQYE